MRVSARSFGKTVTAAMAAGLAFAAMAVGASASDFSEPWKRSDRALVIDAYEYNEIDWQKLATDERIAGFIGKGSDGVPPAYRCSGDETEEALCSALWKRYSVAKELFHTRKAMAKSLGLEWGAYHLARPGNPIEQANHFLDFTQPGPDDLVALDIEENDPEKWMSLEDAEEFARHIKRRIGRFPVLYTNGSTAEHIARNRDRYPLLSRLPLWYARYKPEIGMHFPKGNWENYALWQFVSQTNCDARKCPYRPPGTNYDIDVNVASMSAEELREAWPFDALIDVPEQLIASIPVPTPRAVALAADSVTLTYASVSRPKTVDVFAKVFAGAGANQDKLVVEPDELVETVSAGGAAAVTEPAVVDDQVEPASLPVKRAVTYTRLSTLKAKPAPEPKKLEHSNYHIGTAEYLAWRKDNGLPITLAAVEDRDEKAGPLVTKPTAHTIDTDTQREDARDRATTGSIAVPVDERSEIEQASVIAGQEYPAGSGWFERFKAYLGIF